MDACAWLVTAVYLVAAATISLTVVRRCRIRMEDVERFCFRRGPAEWYAFRAACAVVLVGGIMHFRLVIHRAISHMFT